MEIENIQQNIRAKIFDISNIKIEDDNINLLGKPYYLEPRDLVYLFVIIQEEYQITINEFDLRNNQFTTINKISFIIHKLIHSVMNTKNKY